MSSGWAATTSARCQSSGIGAEDMAGSVPSTTPATHPREPLPGARSLVLGPAPHAVRGHLEGEGGALLPVVAEDVRQRRGIRAQGHVVLDHHHAAFGGPESPLAEADHVLGS